MRSLLCLLVFLPLSLNANPSLRLWEELAPNQKANVESDETGDSIESRAPTLEPFLPSPETATGQAVIVCPGGGYRFLSYEKEGTDIAQWLAQNGIAAFVLKYRLPDSSHDIDQRLSPLLDAKRAIRTVRFNARQWSIDPEKVGIIGFSAGGHLASTLAVHSDNGDQKSADPIERLSSRPDFAVLVYPVISMQENITHPGSRTRLLGDAPSKQEVDFYSNELQITDDSPPTFLTHAGDDLKVPVVNSIRFYEGLVALRIPAELHVYPTGGHGFGLSQWGGSPESWPDLCLNWLSKLQ